MNLGQGVSGVSAEKRKKKFKKLHQDITRNLKIASLNRREFPIFSRNLKIVLKLGITSSCFPRMPKFSESESLVPLYLEIFGRSQLENNKDYILRRIATASPPNDAFEIRNLKTNQRRFRNSEPQNYPKTFPNFGTPKPPKDLSEFRNPKTTQRRFRISEPKNYPKTFPNFGNPKPTRDVSEIRNPKTTQGCFRTSEPQDYPKTFPIFGTPKPPKDVSEIRNPQTTKRHFRISEPPNNNS